MVRFLLLCGLGLAGCYDLREFSGGSVSCDNGACPPGLSCGADGLCWSGGSPVKPRPDAAEQPAIDAAMDAPPLPPDASRRLVSVTLTGDGAGRVVSLPAGIDCPGTCVAEFVQSTSLTLEASAPIWSRVVSLSGACAASPCSLVVDRDLDVTVEMKSNAGGHNFVFITKETFSPSTLGLLTAADLHCNESAAARGLPGQYRAWISNAGTRAVDRLGTARGWVRLDGRPFADSLADLASGRIFNPIWYRSDGGRAYAYYATGTGGDGGGTGVTCADWTSSSATDLVAAGSPSGTTGAWSWGVSSWCNQDLALLCMGIDRSTPLAITPAAGRRAFVSQGTFNGGGVAGVDAICQQEATSAGLSGTFKALIAPIDASPASRFPAGLPWVRVDGVPLTTTGTLDEDSLITTLNVTANGQYKGANHTIGVGAAALEDFGVSATTCDGWTSAASSVSTFIGVPNDLRTFIEGRTLMGSCFPGNTHIYCLEP